MDNTSFNASELSSRKLWQIITDTPANAGSDAELRAAIRELTTRRDYLAELVRIGKLERVTHNA